jgi:NAD(P)-dependent dehydrogenase (short-subunit alcohol dehydrogenase family)
MPKTIVITGTTTGMGRATVTKFAAEGWNVVATVRKESDLEAHADMRSVKTSTPEPSTSHILVINARHQSRHQRGSPQKSENHHDARSNTTLGP